MKILAISDLHGHLPKIDPCDILLLAGDVGVDFRAKEHLLGPFSDWLRGLRARHIIGIAGNHDFEFARDREAYRGLPWTYLQDETVEVEGLKIHGSPYTPLFGSWAFMRRDEDLRHVWNKIPDDTDILVTHGPPYGMLDKNIGGKACGSKTLWERVQQVRPRLHVWGHIHEAQGEKLVEWSDRNTLFANVSHVDAMYRPVSGARDFSALFQED